MGDYSGTQGLKNNYSRFASSDIYCCLFQVSGHYNSCAVFIWQSTRYDCGGPLSIVYSN